MLPWVRVSCRETIWSRAAAPSSHAGNDEGSLYYTRPDAKSSSSYLWKPRKASRRTAPAATASHFRGVSYSSLTQNSPEMGSLSHRIRRKNEKEKKHGKSIIHPRRGGFVFPPTGPEAISFPSKKLTQDRHTKSWPTYYHNHIVNAYTVIVCIVESQFHGGEENCDIESELG